jgi:hypothetical protein
LAPYLRIMKKAMWQVRRWTALTAPERSVGVGDGGARGEQDGFDGDGLAGLFGAALRFGFAELHGSGGGLRVAAGSAAVEYDEAGCAERGGDHGGHSRTDAFARPARRRSELFSPLRHAPPPHAICRGRDKSPFHYLGPGSPFPLAGMTILSK